MKKTLLVVALAVVLVLAFATTAMALGSLPNRSSAFLTTIPTPGALHTGGSYSQAEMDYYNDIRALAAGGTKAAYITWGQATDVMNVSNAGGGSGLTAAQKASPHGNYATTTVKCQVCHSVHKASINGTMLLPGTNGCIACHGSTTHLTNAKVAAGSSLDNRHGGSTSCASYLCHTESPHGVDITEYAAGASVLLSDWSDFLTGAALRSGATDVKQTASKTNVNMDGYVFDSLAVDVYQPALDGADATAVNTAGDARGIAIQTGYTCANEGCHMNGSFNGVSENAYLGNYVLTLGAQSASLYGFDNATGKIKGTGYISFQGSPDWDATNGIYGTNDARTQAIKGHELYTAFSPAVADDPATRDVVETSAQKAWAASGTCRACHDQVDVRLGNNALNTFNTTGKSFPHSNTVWRAYNSGTDSSTATHKNDVTGNQAETFANYGFSAQFNNAAWFMLADQFGGTVENTTIRNPVGADAAFTYAPRTIAQDGACLKCHRGAGKGVGIDY